jgi:GntR family transcriptional regulator, rspAB operon transcriptional repressor
MPVPAPKKSVSRVAAGSRRSGRPRAATAASKVYADLRAELVSLQRRPGDAVSEAQIALAYGVSRTPVREAILKLADEGLLEIYPQSGIIVSRIPVAALPEAIIIRKALEETTARLAAERATSSQVLALQSILERQREASNAGNSEAFHQADEMFHAAVAEIAGHPGIWKFIQQVKLHVDRYRRLTLPQRGRMTQVIVEHEAVLIAIEGHNVEAARHAMGIHLDQLLANISATRHINPEYFDERA